MLRSSYTEKNVKRPLLSRISNFKEVEFYTILGVNFRRYKIYAINSLKAREQCLQTITQTILMRRMLKTGERDRKEKESEREKEREEILLKQEEAVRRCSSR